MVSRSGVSHWGWCFWLLEPEGRWPLEFLCFEPEGFRWPELPLLFGSYFLDLFAGEGEGLGPGWYEAAGVGLLEARGAISAASVL